MLRRNRAHREAADAARPHRTVVSNLLAMQARLRGDQVLPVHPSARPHPAAATAPALRASVEPEPPEPAIDDAPLATVIALPGASTTRVVNRDDDVRRALLRLLELEDRLETLQDELCALVDRLEPEGGDRRLRGTPEDAIVRLQRLIDRRLGTD